MPPRSIPNAEDSLVVRALDRELVPLRADVLVRGKLDALGVDRVAEPVLRIKGKVRDRGAGSQQDWPQAVVELTRGTKIKHPRNSVQRGTGDKDGL